MWNRLAAILSVMVGVFMASGWLFAHHSDTWADVDHIVTIRGTVVQHAFINPHQVIFFAAKDDRGKVTEWRVLGASVSHMHLAGWSQNTIKAGEQLTISGNQSRDGRPIMGYIRIVRANGEELTLGGHKIVTLKNFLDKHGQELSPSELESWKTFYKKNAGNSGQGY